LLLTLPISIIWKLLLLLANCQALDGDTGFLEFYFLLGSSIFITGKNADSFTGNFQAHYVHFQENLFQISESKKPYLSFFQGVVE
jgi:hypothetical protein